MVGKHQIKAIKQILLDLIPACEVSYTQRKSSPKCKHCRIVNTRTGETAGLLVQEECAELWIEGTHKETEHAFIISRPHLTFTKTEKRILHALLDVCRSITIANEIDVVFTQQSISSQFTMPYFLVSYFMRGSNHACLWSSIIGLILLQKLSYKKYEGSTCSSGFLCLKSINNTIKERLTEQSNFIFEEFNKAIPSLTEIYCVPSNSVLDISISTRVALASKPFQTYSANAWSGLYFFREFLIPAEVIWTFSDLGNIVIPPLF